MRRWLAILMLLVVIAGTVIPCCETDGCGSEHTESPGKRMPQGNCSPFFACANCPGFLQIARAPQLPVPAPASAPVHRQKPVHIRLSNFSPAFWQPPRLA